MRQGLHNAMAGALAGGAAGGLAGTLDAYLVLEATGAFWLGPLRILEPLVFEALAYAAAGAALALLATRPLAALVRPGSDPSWVVFRAALFAGTALALSVLAVFHLYDVGLPLERRHETLPFVVAVAGALLAAALAWLGAGLAGRRWGTSRRVQVAVSVGLLAVLGLGLMVLRGHAAGSEFTGVIPRGSPDAPDLVLVVLDTTRADRLSLYGNPRGTSPNLDRIAREGLVYTRAYATGSWTTVSHASLFTGTYASTHRTFSRQTGLLPGLPTLSEALGERGYRTLSASHKEVLTRDGGWVRGFDTAVTFNLEDRAVFAHRRVSSKLRGVSSFSHGLIHLAIRWMGRAQATDRPFFVFLNLNDPHTRYIPRDPFYRAYLADLGLDLDDVDRDRLLRLASDQNRKSRKQSVSEKERAVLQALYDSEIAYMDAAMERLFSWLEERHRQRPLVLIVTSDHGEMLGEHNLLYHGKALYEELIRVPFVVWAKPSLGRGRSDELVSLVDVFPTLLDLAGGDSSAHPQLAGRRLWRDPAPETVFAEYWPKERPMKAVVGRRAKLLWQAECADKLFDLRDDPGESRDASTLFPREAERLAAALRASFDLESVPDAQDVEIEDSMRRRLEALGYLGE